jgi:hypothetical protein
MPIPPGTHMFGPENATLAVRTGRTGKASKAGHDLLLDVTAWRATIEVDDGSVPVSIALDADATSLRVREGTGGLKALDDDDRANIEQTIDDEVLNREAIEFRSTSVRADDGRLSVEGDLTLAGATRPLAFDVTLDGDDGLSGSAVVKQSDWGMKLYSSLFGALRVADDVHVSFEAQLAST